LLHRYDNLDSGNGYKVRSLLTLLGRAALAVMEGHLVERQGFVADQGGHDLTPYPATLAWLARVAAQAGPVPITLVPRG